MKTLAALDGYIEYVCVRLKTLSRTLRSAPEGIIYNHVAWQLLKGPLCYYPAVELFADRRNRETHRLLKFDGYIETKCGVERAEKGKQAIALSMHHYHWKSANEFKAEERAQVEFGVRGIEAADFVCWAIKRKYENEDNRWYSTIERRIKWKQHLYFDPQMEGS